MTNEWLQGYLAALKNLESFCDTNRKSSTYDQAMVYASTTAYIKQVRENYRELVNKLNEESNGTKS